MQGSVENVSVAWRTLFVVLFTTDIACLADYKEKKRNLKHWRCHIQQ